MIAAPGGRFLHLTNTLHSQRRINKSQDTKQKLDREFTFVCSITIIFSHTKCILFMKHKSIIVGKITGNSEEVKPIFYQKNNNKKSTAKATEKVKQKSIRETIFYHLFHY